MAKSLRSKWKRKMRASKRVRYGKKELDILKNMLETHMSDDVNRTAVDMQNGENVAEQDVKEKKNPVVEENNEDEETKQENMDVDKRVFSMKTMKDQHGKYPVWLSARKIRKLGRNKKNMKKQKNKKSGKVEKRQR